MNQVIGKTALVTGANRGIGAAFVAELLDAGVSKIYACARNLETLKEMVAKSDGKVIPVQLDITNTDMVATAAATCTDVDILINNAGIATFKRLLAAEETNSARQEMEVNYFGTLNMIRAFAPVLKNNGGGAIINVSSILGMINFSALGSYCASKAAVHSLTQGTRAELSSQGTLVTGVYPGPTDTDMGANFPMEKASPTSIAKAAIEAIKAGEEDVFPDPTSQKLRAGLMSDPKAVEKQASQM